MSEPPYVAADRAYQQQYYRKHREKKIAYQRAYHAAKRQQINRGRQQKRIDAGLPVRLEPALSRPTASRRDYNALHYAERRAVELLRLKIASLQKVSGLQRPACCKCGCSDIRVLTINHINGNGRAEGLAIKGARSLRAMIVSGERPVGDLDVRCCNCNTLYEYERGKWRLPRDWEAIIEDMTLEK